MERRLEERIETKVHLKCRVPATPSPAIMRDLSHTGCKLEICGAAVQPGATAVIDLPGALKMPGLVVWVQGNLAGVRFHRRLSKGAAIALGLDEAEPEPVEEPVEPSAVVEGLLRHWFRRLAGCLS